MRRRTVLVGGSTFALALAGPGSASVFAEADTGDVDDVLPAPSALDGEYVLVHRADLAAFDDPADAGHLLRLSESFGLDTDDIDEVIVAPIYETGVELLVFRGSFSAFDDGEERDDGWWIDLPEDGRETIASRDGLAIIASHADEEVREDVVETVIDRVAGAVDSLSADDETAARMLSLLADERFAIVYFDIDVLGYDADDSIDRIGLGAAADPATRAGTVEDRIVVTPPDADREALIELLEELHRGALLEYDDRETDGILVMDATFELAPRRDRSAAPDARFDVDADPDEGTVELHVTHADELETADLELWIDGELAADQPANETDIFVSGDVIELEPGPIASVYLRWIDEEAGVYDTYVNEVVGADAIEPAYNPEAESVTFTYTADEPADTDRLVVDAHDGELEQLPDTLTAGDTIEVTDVPLESFVALLLDVDGDPATGVRPSDRLVTYRPTPPFARVTRRPDEPPVLHLSGQGPFDASSFTVTYDGDPIDAQPADETDELAPGDRFELPDASFGTQIELRWTAPPEDVTVTEYVVTPELQVGLAYDAATGELNVRHEFGEDVPADELELVDEDEPTDDQLADELDTFAEGDAMRTAVAPFRQVALIWTDGEEREQVAAKATGRDAFDAAYEYDDERLVITYAGNVDADPERLVLERRGRARGDGPYRPFAAEYDVLSPGDEIALEDVDPDEFVLVYLDVDTADDHVRGRTVVWEYTPKPRHSFSIRSVEDGVEVGFRDPTSRDPETVDIAVDGDQAAVQFADEYDELTSGDAIAITELEVGTEVTVRWTVPEEPVEVAHHVVTPEVDFTFELADGILTVEHADGDPIEESGLEVVIEYPEFDRIAWDDEEIVAGDAITIEVGANQAFAVVLFAGDVLAHGMVEAS